MKLTALATRLAHRLTGVDSPIGEGLRAPGGRRAGAPTTRTAEHARPRRGSEPGAASAPPHPVAAAAGAGYLGDWLEPLPPNATWRPQHDGLPDPGEVVWAWVPFEEDHARGKDRPVLVLAPSPHSADVVLALPLTSKNHDRDAEQEAHAGRHWMDVGAGAWDRSGRPSEARLDRVLQLRLTEVRREGAALPEGLFREVYAAAKSMSGA